MKSLETNALLQKSEVFIFADGLKKGSNFFEKMNFLKTRKILEKWKFGRKKYLIKREKNWGLAENIKAGITQVIQDKGKVIVLEDDIEVSSGFLKYMNAALNIYEKEEKVMHISAYFSPIIWEDKEKIAETFFYNHTSCWGWGTWARAWKNFEDDAEKLVKLLESKEKVNYFEIEGAYPFLEQLEGNAQGKLNTWQIKWYALVTLKGGLCLHPKVSLTRNTGFDGSGEHCHRNSIYQNQSFIENIEVKPIFPLKENYLAREKMQKFYYQLQQTTWKPTLKDYIQDILKSLRK